MKQETTLFRVLLDLAAQPHFAIAKELRVSASSLSRHASGQLSRRSVLDRAAKWFAKAGVNVDAATLKKTITAQALIRAAILGGNHE